MAEFYRLQNRAKHYEWGSPGFIPDLLGFPRDGKPYAELWMGSHPGSPSLVELPGGAVGLGEFIGGNLPYLLKLLAAESPLSIQAHPTLEQARKGFARENGAGLAPDAPDRSYRDSNHKPEVVCALTPFTGMCGFRAPAEIAELVGTFLGENPPAVLREGFAPLLNALESPAEESALRNFLAALFGIPPAMRGALTEFILTQRRANERDGCEWELMRSFAGQYPGDPAVVAPLYLNVFRLKPGEAVFLKAGVLHAYVRGFAVELMASSDNVLRGGLTPKHIDVPELMRVLDFAPLKPKIMRPEPGVSSFTYPTPCDDFSLTVMRGTGNTAELPLNGPSICVVTAGEGIIGREVLRKGESIFVPPAASWEKPLTLRGVYTLHIASTGNPSANAQ